MLFLMRPVPPRVTPVHLPTPPSLTTSTHSHTLPCPPLSPPPGPPLSWHLPPTDVRLPHPPVH
jgi:hypothetical protein